MELAQGTPLGPALPLQVPTRLLNDNTVRIGQHVIDIPPAANKGHISYAHARVEVQERFDGSFVVYMAGHWIATKVLAEPIPVYRTRRKTSSAEQPPITKPKQPQALPAGPWRPAKNPPLAKHNPRTPALQGEGIVNERKIETLGRLGFKGSSQHLAH